MARATRTAPEQTSCGDEAAQLTPLPNSADSLPQFRSPAEALAYYCKTTGLPADDPTLSKIAGVISLVRQFWPIYLATAHAAKELERVHFLPLDMGDGFGLMAEIAADAKRWHLVLQGQVALLRELELSGLVPPHRPSAGRPQKYWPERYLARLVVAWQQLDERVDTSPPRLHALARGLLLAGGAKSRRDFWTDFWKRAVKREVKRANGAPNALLQLARDCQPTGALSVFADFWRLLSAAAQTR